MNIIFKNPRIKYRKEDFGGILKTDTGIFMIDNETLTFLESFIMCSEEYLQHNDIVSNLLEINGLIKINKEDALCIQKKQKK